MAVQIDVANPVSVVASAATRNVSVKCYALAEQTDKDIQSQVDEVMDPIVAAAEVFRNAQINYASAAKLGTSAIEPIRSMPYKRDELDRTFEVQKHQRELHQLRDEIAERIDKCKTPDSATSALVARWRGLQNTFAEELHNQLQTLQAQTQQTLQKEAVDPPSASKARTLRTTLGEDVAKAASVAEAAIAHAQCRDVICGGALGGSLYAYAITSLPETEWHTKFNRAFAKGANGNLDIVIKLNSQADFTVKGMRFDVGKIPEVARKAVTQALLLATQIAGVPPSRTIPASDTDSQSIYGTGQDVAATLQKQDQRKALVAARRETLMSLAITIASNRAQLANSGGRSALKAAIDARMAASEALLRLTSYPAK